MGRLAVTTLAVAALLAVGVLLAWSFAGLTHGDGGGPAPVITATCPPTGTPDPLWVEPVHSPTYDFSQVVTVTLNRCDYVTIAAESGHFTATCVSGQALVNVLLYPNVEHHLRVTACVPTWWWGVCYYWGYCLETGSDRQGYPLTIRQVCEPCFTRYLPLLLRQRP